MTWMFYFLTGFGKKRTVAKLWRMLVFPATIKKRTWNVKNRFWNCIAHIKAGLLRLSQTSAAA